MSFQKVQCSSCGAWYWDGDPHTCQPQPGQTQIVPPPVPVKPVYQMLCPRCKSPHHFMRRTANPAVVGCLGCVCLWPFLMALPFILAKHYTCMDCGHQWTL
jgi:hypothetical protein